RRRRDWFEGQPDLAPERLVFIDETWASTNMARRHGRRARGERLRVGVPHGHWTTTTFIGALTPRGFIAPFVLDGPINREAFAKLKALLRKAAQRTAEGLRSAIGDMLPVFKPQECRNYFAAAGYDAD
ncbi:MAG: transposase, partial [Microcystis panniformis]